jgi:alkanesulfonate monooxygenase SsuD/methylene tetrahydromethanopterin reductase-like flavin-dependent oxidoreductase (luciferase family)
VTEPVEVGLRLPHGVGEDGARLRAFAAAVDESSVDAVWVGDHVSFHGGTGYDGLQQATALAALTERVGIATAVYLLPLRHPLPVARQVATLGRLAPGRFTFGVGVGGDDPGEVANCGVDPRTRGRRTDEALALLRPLLAGETVTADGEFFPLRGASIGAAPDPAVPILVGGRAPAARRRAGRLGDGWLGVFVSPERFAAGVAEVEQAAAAAGRGDFAGRHGMLVWCGFGPDARAARPALAAAMEGLYRQPFERFERYTCCGTPDEVAAGLQPFVDAGARVLHLAAAGPDPTQAVAAAASVRATLRRASTPSPPEPRPAAAAGGSRP